MSQDSLGSSTNKISYSGIQSRVLIGYSSLISEPTFVDIYVHPLTLTLSKLFQWLKIVFYIIDNVLMFFFLLKKRDKYRIQSYCWLKVARCLLTFNKSKVIQFSNVGEPHTELRTLVKEEKLKKEWEIIKCVVNVVSHLCLMRKDMILILILTMMVARTRCSQLLFLKLLKLV